MAQRKWFTPGICQGMTEADCSIMNRAVRHLVGSGKATTGQLMQVRMLYKPGLSARDILDKIEGEESAAESRFYAQR